VLKFNLFFSRRWRIIEAIISKTDGFDKASKVMQYVSRLATMWMVSSHRGDYWRGKTEPFGAHLTEMRKIIRLGKWFYTLPAVRNGVRGLRTPEGREKMALVELVNDVLAVVTDVADDICWLEARKFVPQHVGDMVGDFGNQCWWVTTFLDTFLVLHSIRQNVNKEEKLLALLDTQVKQSVALAAKPNGGDALHVDTGAQGVHRLKAEIAILKWKRYLMWVTVCKFMSDSVSASLTVFGLEKKHRVWVYTFNLFSGLFSFHKLYSVESKSGKFS